MRVPAKLLSSIEMHWIHQLRPELNKYIGRPHSGRLVRVTYRILVTTNKTLFKAGRHAKITKTAYVEQALKEKFERDGIIKSEPQ
jgi:hypothetical protein